MRRQRNRECRKGRVIVWTVVALLCTYIIFTVFLYPRSGNHYLPGNIDTVSYAVEQDLRINSSNAILINLDNNKLLFEKNSGARIYPASMTKIMTAVVALENLNNLNKSVKLNEKMYSGIYAADAMVAGFLPNEEVRVLDLLYGLILPSGAECAIGLAEYVAGSEKAFVDLMNDKAQALGMDSTHFVNVTGLHDVEHYSTVEDIAVLLRYALKNDTFYEVFTTVYHSSRPTNLHKDGITYYSSLFANLNSAYFKDGSILGGKTGYTAEAGQCLASLAEKNGNRYILITCGARGDRKTQTLHIDDAIAVYAAVLK